jgi:hypothetical protein
MKTSESVLFESARKLQIGLIGLMMLAGSSSLWAKDVITQIDNTSHFAYSNGPDNPVAFLLPFATPGRFAIGESFEVPEGTNNIESLALWINPAQSVNDLHLSIYLAPWDPVTARIKGPPLSWEGPDGYMYLQFPTTAPGYYQLYFNTEGQAPARAGTSYMLFMTADEFLPGNSAPKFGYIPTGAYDDGSAWTANTSSLADLTRTKWDPWAGDLAFAVQFTPGESPPPLTSVPEPATYGLIAGCGLIAFSFFKRNRRRIHSSGPSLTGQRPS